MSEQELTPSTREEGRTEPESAPENGILGLESLKEEKNWNCSSGLQLRTRRGESPSQEQAKGSGPEILLSVKTLQLDLEGKVARMRLSENCKWKGTQENLD